MMVVPKFFERELKLIDPLYFAEWNADNEYWEVKRKMTEFHTSQLRGISVKLHNPTVGVFSHLNDKALNELRERKWLRRRYPGKTYLDWILGRAKEAKEKKKQLGLEMAVEGFMKIGNWGKSVQFDMGAVNKEKKDDASRDTNGG